VVSVYILCCRAGFQVLRDFSTPDCFVVCLCLIHGGVLARACAYMYIGRIYMCMCIYLRIYTQRLYVCVYICVFVYRFYIWVCIDLRIWTPRLHVCVCISTSIIQSLHVLIYTQSSHVSLYILPYKYAEFTQSLHVCVYVCVHTHRCTCVCKWLRIWTQSLQV